MEQEHPKKNKQFSLRGGAWYRREMVKKQSNWLQTPELRGDSLQ